MCSAGHQLVWETERRWRGMASEGRLRQVCIYGQSLAQINNDSHNLLVADYMVNIPLKLYITSPSTFWLDIQWNLAIPATHWTCKIGWISEVSGSQRTSLIHWLAKLAGLGPARLAALARWPHFRGLD